jgi:NTE family protein
MTDTPTQSNASYSLDGRKYDADGIALSLSGGGYKAAAFHLGAILRLNELGLLGRLKRISSVSGGSIISAFLGLKWRRLDWVGGTATNLESVFVSPFLEFLTTANVDISAAVVGYFLPTTSGAISLEASYKKRLFGEATLQDLPDDDGSPRFVILATNYELNSLWRFSKAYAADYRVGMIDAPHFSLAKVVAASSGFPPFFCPVTVDFAGHELRQMPGTDMHKSPFTERTLLADGGIYDNLGLEPNWKRYGVLLVSNAGDAFDDTSKPPLRWVPLLRRTLSMVHRQAENNRVRWLMEMAQQGRRKVAYWPLRPTEVAYPAVEILSPAQDDIAAAVCEPVRLWGLKPASLRRLVQHGYSVCDAAIRSYILLDAPAPSALPEV